MTKSNYTEANIKILKDLEPIKLRPGQFTRTDTPLHMIQEVLDNAIDEALGGYAQNVCVIAHSDGSVSIADDGRGIPVGLHPEKNIPVVQAIFTMLYSGGKFEKTGGGAYSFAGGLHGVGVCVTNALSDRLDVTVVRDGWKYRIVFSNGDVVEPLKKVERSEGQGTTIRIKPNPKYFSQPEIPLDELKELLKSKAVLLPGLKIEYSDRRNEDRSTTEVFQYSRGMSAYLLEVAKESPIVPLIEGQAYAQDGDENFSEGEGAAWAFSWFESGDASGKSFVNLIPTPLHGTHVSGLKAAIFTTVKTFIEHHGLLPKGLKLTAEDVFKHVRFVLSARMLDPSFDNQTKDRLSSRDGVKLVEKMLQPHLDAWANHNTANAKIVAELVIKTASARQRASIKTEKRRNSSIVMLPGKLADCESDEPELRELFLVEGDSAGGSAKAARIKDCQAILPLRGKSLNVWEKTKEEALSNEEIHDISVAIGIPLHTVKDSLEFNKLRYHKICILSDADVDGFHIQTLLLTLFFKHFPQLVQNGYVYVSRPPLYRIDADAVGKKKQAKKLYAMDEAERLGLEEKLKKEGYLNLKVGRFKGLGEMNPEDLWDTTLNPDTRRLLRVTLPEEKKAEAVEMFDNLMSKDRASWRREWMGKRGDEVDAG